MVYNLQVHWQHIRAKVPKSFSYSVALVRRQGGNVRLESEPKNPVGAPQDYVCKRYLEFIKHIHQMLNLKGDVYSCRELLVAGVNLTRERDWSRQVLMSQSSKFKLCYCGCSRSMICLVRDGCNGLSLVVVQLSAANKLRDVPPN